MHVSIHTYTAAFCFAAALLVLYCISGSSLPPVSRLLPHQPLHLYIYLSIYLSVYPCIHLSVYLSIYTVNVSLQAADTRCFTAFQAAHCCFTSALLHFRQLTAALLVLYCISGSSLLFTTALLHFRRLTAALLLLCYISGSSLLFTAALLHFRQLTAALLLLYCISGSSHPPLSPSSRACSEKTLTTPTASRRSGAQFTRFTGTTVQILTLLRRSGTQFTRFTGTTVQILTLLRRCSPAQVRGIFADKTPGLLWEGRAWPQVTQQ
jgi:hypothetical protein